MEISMQTFIAHDAKEAAAHWAECEKNHAPFISVRPIGPEFAEIFFDVTNLSQRLEEISASVRNISRAYCAFFMLPAFVYADYLSDEDAYCFRIPVRLEHAEWFAGQLFHFLANKIKEAP